MGTAEVVASAAKPPTNDNTPINQEPSQATTTPSKSPADPSKWTIIDTPQDASLIPTIAVILWLGWNGFLVWISLYVLFVANKVERMVILGLCTVSLVLPPEFPGRIGVRIGDWMMGHAEKYFGLKTIIENEQDLLAHAAHPHPDNNDKHKALIFAFEPHDVLPYAVFAFNRSLRRLPGKIGQDGCCLVTSAIFSVPLMKHVYTWVGLKSVDKRTFVRRLKSGESFTFCPGGVQEVILMNNSSHCNNSKDNNDNDDNNVNKKELTLYLRKRKGFIKHALSHGSPIVPVFAFNLDGSYGYWIPRGKFVEKISRKMGVLPLFFWGRWGIPFGIPNPQKIVVVIGEAMDVPNLGEGEGVVTSEMINKYHDMFLKELEALFERHKVEAGYGDRVLNIV